MNPAIERIRNVIDNVPAIRLDSLPKEETALIIVDVINGFAKEGNLSSPRINGIIPPIAKLQEKCVALGISIVAFADNHTEDSVELKNFVTHCLADTEESEIVDELKAVGGYRLIKKNSTNGFLEEEFTEWYRQNPGIKNWIVVGDCTDICILNFALSMKNDMNRRNIDGRVIVPVSMVETYDLDTHDAGLLNIMALYIMMTQGVEIVKDIE